MEMNYPPLASLPVIRASWEEAMYVPPPPQAISPRRVPCTGFITITLEPWAGVWDAPLTFTFVPTLYEADLSGFFDVTTTLLLDTEEVRCCLRMPGTGRKLEEQRLPFGTALETANREKVAALQLAHKAEEDAKYATFASRKVMLRGAIDELYSLRCTILTLSRQKRFLLHQHLQFTNAAAFDLSGGSTRKGEVVSVACGQRDDVGAVEILHPDLGPRTPRLDRSHIVLNEEEAFASVEDLRTGVLRFINAAERAGVQLATLKRVVVRAGLEGLGAPDTFLPWEVSQLKMLKAEFDAEAGGVSIIVVKG